MKINEIFYSLQGEGYYTGTSSVFIRFSGCNLQCTFCDTLHQEGEEMSEEAIIDAVRQYPARHIVITGGEPSLFLTESLVDKLHREGKFVAVETNGTHLLPHNVDWITLSPKEQFVATSSSKVCLKRCNELKLVYTGTEPVLPDGVEAKYYFLQPCDVGDEEQNAQLLQEAVAYCLQHPKWRLSLQMHKILGVR